MKIHGHRGGFKPENTMQGFASAIENGLDAIELDVLILNFVFTNLNSIGMAY